MTAYFFIRLLIVFSNCSRIYGGFARNCYAVTDNNVTHLVTDENGCATDPTIFGQWLQNPETQMMVSSFNAFKFPASDNIRFQCNIRVCFGRCQPVNCDGVDAFGRRRRRQIDSDGNLEPKKHNLTEVEIRESVIAGQLREEIMVSSNSRRWKWCVKRCASLRWASSSPLLSRPSWLLWPSQWPFLAGLWPTEGALRSTDRSRIQPSSPIRSLPRQSL